MAYDAVLFDNDGVITELTDRAILRDAVRETFRTFDVTDPREEHVENLLVGVTIERLRGICGEYDLEPAAFWHHRDSNASRVQREAVRDGRKPLYDDVPALLDGLGVPAGVVSSNQQATIDCIVDHYDLGGVFDTHYGREPTLDGIRRKKPETYYLDRALADLGAGPDGDLHPASTLYVGDSESDVVAAHRAGMDSAFVRRPHRDGYDLGVEPTYEVDRLDVLLDIASD